MTVEVFGRPFIVESDGHARRDDGDRARLKLVALIPAIDLPPVFIKVE